MKPTRHETNEWHAEWLLALIVVAVCVVRILIGCHAK